MKAFSPVTRSRPAGAAALARTIALAIVLAGVWLPAPGEAGTKVRGRIIAPASRSVTLAGGEKVREQNDLRQAVVYVTPSAGTKPLKGKRTQERVTLAGSRFQPSVTAFAEGSTIRFENTDRVWHNVFSVSPARRFDIGKLAPGTRTEVGFDSGGVVQLFCELHPAAAGFVVVCPNRYFIRPASSGRYQLPALPRGEYVVTVWHPGLGSVRRGIDVSGRGDYTLDLRF
ncbi:MAG TPA: carboxypeptidase regulatory-like domain-containing protein [Candidatus Eisenbacteria bacterium]|nr:carboxypeptidase regulatory-like domain-containing protein [Candidatus Eisenbacteria bacterium]